MSRHRNLAVRPGQDAAAVVGRVLWRRRRSNGDEVVARVVGAPRPHVRLEVWRGPTEHVVHLAVSELAEVAVALLHVPRVLAGSRGGPT